MGFFKNRVRRRVWNEYKPGPPSRTPESPLMGDPEVLSPEVVFTFMDAADNRSQQVTLAVIEESMEMARQAGNQIRVRSMKKDLQWLAKLAAKQGLHWDRVP